MRLLLIVYVALGFAVSVSVAAKKSEQVWLDAETAAREVPHFDMIFNNYEVQVLDSFALDLNEANNAIPTESRNTQWCGALYKAKIPDLNMAFPPLAWQTYDIVFKAPRFEGEVKVENARITVHHNGVKIHDNVELKAGTGAGAKRKQVAQGPIFFQGHGNPVVYRNVWATALEE